MRSLTWEEPNACGQPRLARWARDEDVDAEAFDGTLAVSRHAPFLLARRVLAGMRERGFGRILFVSSAGDGGMHPR